MTDTEDALWKAAEESVASTRKTLDFLALADYLDEHGEDSLARALRWCVKAKKRPRHWNKEWWWYKGNLSQRQPRRWLLPSQIYDRIRGGVLARVNALRISTFRDDIKHLGKSLDHLERIVQGDLK